MNSTGKYFNKNIDGWSVVIDVGWLVVDILLLLLGNVWMSLQNLNINH